MQTSELGHTSKPGQKSEPGQTSEPGQASEPGQTCEAGQTSTINGISFSSLLWISDCRIDSVALHFNFSTVGVHGTESLFG